MRTAPPHFHTPSPPPPYRTLYLIAGILGGVPARSQTRRLRGLTRVRPASVLVTVLNSYLRGRRQPPSTSMTAPPTRRRSRGRSMERRRREASAAPHRARHPQAGATPWPAHLRPNAGCGKHTAPSALPGCRHVALSRVPRGPARSDPLQRDACGRQRSAGHAWQRRACQSSRCSGWVNRPIGGSHPVRDSPSRTL